MNLTVGGADEAGKGALIGPLVIAYVIISEQDLAKYVQKYNIRDSKLIQNTRVIAIYEALKLKIKHYFSIVTPLEIDNKNLNTLLTEKYATLLTRESTTNNVTIDCPIHLPSLFSSRIYELTGRRIYSCHKADTIYPVVSLASIFAKAKRELIVADIKNVLKLDIGSGYPSDPRTKLAYKLHYAKLDPFIRKKWQIKD